MDTIEPLRDALEGFNRRDMAALKAVLAQGERPSNWVGGFDGC
jgi:hypothetical protein